jgi:Arc-like DNA binding domain
MARKRAAGGGRKPRGPFSQLTSSFTLRMPNDLRKKLERAAKKRPGGGSIGQELLQRLQRSFAEENEEERDSMLRIFDTLMDGMLGIIVPVPRRHWEKDPWLYRAFYCAVSNMFSRFRPEGAELGKEKLPESWRFMVATERKKRPDDHVLAHITQSPEAMGAFAEENMSRMFLEPSLLRNSLDRIRARSGTEFSADQAERFAARFEDLDYGLSHARRIMKRHTDKGVRQRGGQRTW